MELKFSKMHGIGNDFILIDDRKKEISGYKEYKNLAEKLCERHFGIGADGLIVLNESEKNDFQFRIFNHYGREPEMCGNGIRCFSKYIYEKKITTKTKLHIETLAGIIIPELSINEYGLVQNITVDMGEPILKAKEIPFISEEDEAIYEKIEVKSFGTVYLTAVSMGNPHAVIFVDDIEKINLHKIGPLIENHIYFPEKTNVEFIEIISKDEIIMKVWERGAGETLACGTGACASLVAGVLNSKLNNSAVIHLPGGDLNITWNRDNNHIYKSGPAEFSFEGILQI